MAETARPLWRRSLLGPVVLIGLGILLLLTNLGYLPWDIWRTLWQFWPVLLILLGLELLVSGRASWGSVFFAILVLLVAGLLAGAGFFWGEFAPPREPGRAGPFTHTFQQPSGDISEAQVSVSFGAGRLDITGGAAEGMLAEGESGGSETVVSASYREAQGVGRLDVESEDGQAWRWFNRHGGDTNQLVVRLTEHVPIRRLEVDSGAVNARLELGTLRVQNLDLDLGASNTHVRFPAAGQVQSSINAGFSNLLLEVPEGVALRLRVEGGLSSLDVDERRFPLIRQEGVGGLAGEQEYRSPDFDTAANRLDVRMSVGAASVEVR